MVDPARGEVAGFREFAAIRAIVFKRPEPSPDAVEAYSRALALEPDWSLIRLARSGARRGALRRFWRRMKERGSSRTVAGSR